MRWQRVTVVSRLFCLLFGIVGLLIGWLLLSDVDQLRKQPLETVVYIVIAALGGVPFLLAGIWGKFPNISQQDLAEGLEDGPSYAVAEEPASTSWTAGLGRTVFALIVVGAYVAGIHGASLWRMGRDGDWSWWQYALAISALFAVMLLGQGAFAAVFAPFTWLGADQPHWKKTISYSLIVALGVALIVGPYWLVNLSR